MEGRQIAYVECFQQLWKKIGEEGRKSVENSCRILSNSHEGRYIQSFQAFLRQFSARVV